MNTEQNTGKKWVFYGIMVAGILISILSACDYVYQDTDKDLVKKQYDADLRLLNTGYIAFSEAKYKNAMAIFQTVSNTTEVDAIAARAEFGIACIRLTTVKDRSQYFEALNQWRETTRSHQEHLTGKDLMLLETLINGCAPAAVAVEKRDSKPDDDLGERRMQEKALLEKEQKLQGAEKELTAMKQKMKSCRELKTLLEQRDQELATLREKITAMEKIDQKIQKKKEAISLPE